MILYNKVLWITSSVDIVIIIIIFLTIFVSLLDTVLPISLPWLDKLN